MPERYHSGAEDVAEMVDLVDLAEMVDLAGNYFFVGAATRAARHIQTRINGRV